MLDKQCQLYSVDTGNFYSNREVRLHIKNHKLRKEKRELKKKISETESNVSIGQEDKDKQLEDLNRILKHKNELINKSKNALTSLLKNKVEANTISNGKHHIRELRDNDVSKKEIVSIFDANITRTLNCSQDELTESLMIVQVYYFDILKDILNFGYIYKGERYIYYTSSAGQIRTKKALFIKESLWKQYEKTIMCGLSVDIINSKGGCNPNKYLAYLALNNSATDIWKEFDIDKSIVIDDFETDVYGTFDLIDDADYSIHRKTDYIPITHTDGGGMMLPCMGKNRMVRLPWLKGLLGVFDFRRFIEVNNCSPIIKDIYGVEHNIIKEDIQIIFTKSQLKMWKYYDSWEQYKEYYKYYGCTAGYANIEKDRIKNATINYQMLQTLTDITNDEIYQIASCSIDTLNNLCNSVSNIKDIFGINAYNSELTPLQKAVQIYPDLINDNYMKAKIRQIKDSLIKKYKAGKLKINGKYTFILPDFYAACEYWFKNIKQPKGLLSDGEVFCQLYKHSEKLDCLRSPHLFKEHAVRKNVAFINGTENDRVNSIREWFITDALYTSSYDFISKILQFDVDGDSALVVADKIFIDIAERNMKGIVPLYYNMRKSAPIVLNTQNVYSGLEAAFVGGNIGIISNNISKIWNSDVFSNGTTQEKKDAIELVKLLCCENNFVIDYAKTLYKPTRPDEIHQKITDYTNNQLPYFFVYAKDKEKSQVENANNSLVNQLGKIIKNPRLNFRRLGLKKVDYKLLMSKNAVSYKIEYDDNEKVIKNKLEPLIIKYNELSKRFGYIIDNETWHSIEHIGIDNFTYLKHQMMYKNVINECKDELSKFGYSEKQIADILVDFLYHRTNNKHKELLWVCYGEQLYHNLYVKIHKKFKYIQCIDCEEWFEVYSIDNHTCRCPECLKKYKRNYIKKYKQRLLDKNV